MGLFCSGCHQSSGHKCCLSVGSEVCCALGVQVESRVVSGAHHTGVYGEIPLSFPLLNIARGKLLWVWLRASVIFTATLLPGMLYVKRISVDIAWGLGELTALPTGRWGACHQLQWVSYLEGRDGCTRGIFMFLAC